MWSNIWRKITTTVTGGAIILATASVVSRLLGLIRDRLLASHFGAGDVLDTYYAAFKIPDLIFNILVLGALSSAFIPVFIQYLERSKDDQQRHEELWRFSNSLLNIILLGLVFIGALMFIFTHQLMPIIAPGFSPEKQEVTAHLTRIMLVTILFFGVSNIASGILNSFRKYFSFAFAPVMYNLGIIFGIIILVPRYGVYGLAYGVVIGAFLHFLIQIPSLVRSGFRYRPVIDLKHEGVRQVGKLMVPRTLGLAVAQVDQLISVIIGSTLIAGSVAVFNLANNLQSFAINVFGVSLAIASFPIFSEAFAQKNTEKFVIQFSVSFRRILFLIIPTSVLMLLLRAQIVRVILGAGAFNWEDTRLTAQALGYFSLSLFAQSLIPLLARSFYALHDTKTPVKIAVVSVIINTIGALTLSRYMGVMGLALAFSISSLVNMFLLLWLLRKRIGYLDDTKIVNSTLKLISISSIMGVVVWISKYIMSLGINMHTFIGIFIQGVGSALIGLVVYLILAIIFKCDEIKIITDWWKRTKKQMVNGHNGSGTIEQK
jgi:putative peptidoglycan lipid II flippase